MIDRRLAANRRVHLRKQRGGYLYVRNSAHEASCRETRHVANHTPAECVQRGPAIAAALQERIEHSVQRGPVLVGLAVGKLDAEDLSMQGLQGAPQARQVQ